MSSITLELNRSELQIPAGPVALSADVMIPPDARAVVLFAHGSGSSRHSPRNQYVAAELNEGRLATVLADLLTLQEELVDERTSGFRFDIELLTRRLVAIIDWAAAYKPLARVPIVLFGASTGAAAALDAAAARPGVVRAVVCRGGRVDLATEIARVRAAVLFIVGGEDELVLDLNRKALPKLPGLKKLEVVPRASHLFEEPGALEQVAKVARNWIVDLLRGA